VNRQITQTAGEILKAALEGLKLWENDGVGLDDYLDRYVKNDLRPPVSSLLFEYFRNKALVDRLISIKCSRAPKPRYRRLLAIVLTQCFFQDGIRPESAVNVAVDMARKKFGKSNSGFINGVLRNTLRDGIQEHQKQMEENPLLYFPKILQKRWKNNFDLDILSSMSSALLTGAPLTFRITGEVKQEDLDFIKAEEIPLLDWAPEQRYFSAGDRKALFKKDLLKQGKIYIQDPAASMAPSIIEINGGERILDMCAAPGGKTLILAERLKSKGGGKLVAADRSAKRQELTKENFACRNLDCDIVSGTAEELNLLSESFDIILADVPCTNTGVFRHKVDALWRFTEKSLSDTVKLQRGILEAACRLIAPGGKIVYSTCSIEAEENSLLIQEFLAENPGFKLLKERLILPNAERDGAFAAVIEKTV
jgi:16S rRNA (cytosine967-C5)-methyltransferase